MSSRCVASTEEEAETRAIAFMIFCILLAVVLTLSKALHARPKINGFLSEPAMVLIVGIIFSYLFSLAVHEGLRNEEESSSKNDGDDEYAAFYGYDDDDVVDELDEELEGVARTMLAFSPHVFYTALLPPILYNSGYELEREMFMRHFKPIALFAVAGTTISGFGTGFLLYLVQCLGWFRGFNPSLLELLTFGSLIAATDTVSVLGVLKAKRVDPHLFSLVFGESALNDGVALVLFKAFADMLNSGDSSDDLWTSVKLFLRNFAITAIGSPIMGIVFSFLTAIMFKHGDFKEQKEIELSVFVLLMYIPFVLAETMHLSGIVCIFFTGIFARRYIEPNLSERTRETAKEIFKLVAYLAETCIFLHVGLSIFGFQNESLFIWDFIFFALISALAGRALSVYPISILFNCSLKETAKEPLLDDDDGNGGDDPSIGSVSTTSASSHRSGRSGFGWKTPVRRKDKKIPFNFMHILWFAGLRGAVAYACATNFPNVNGNRNVFLAATIIIVLVTVVIMGALAETMITSMGIRVNVDEKEYMKEWRSRRKLKGCFHRLERKYLERIAVRDYKASEKDLPTNPYAVDRSCREGNLVGGTKPTRHDLTTTGEENSEEDLPHMLSTCEQQIMELYATAIPEISELSMHTRTEG